MDRIGCVEVCSVRVGFRWSQQLRLNHIFLLPYTPCIQECQPLHMPLSSGCSINIGLPHNAQYQASSSLLRTSSLLSVTYVVMTHFKTQLSQDLDPCFTSSKTTWQAVYIKLPHNCIEAVLIPFLNDFFFLGSHKVVSLESRALQ